MKTSRSCFLTLLFMTGKHMIFSFKNYAQCLKITQNVAFEFFNFAISHHCTIKLDPSGNTVWSQASVFQKLAKNGPLLAFLIHPAHSKHSSFRSQCWMLLLGRFSNNVSTKGSKVCNFGNSRNEWHNNNVFNTFQKRH